MGSLDPTSGQVIWHTALQQIPLVLGTFSDVEPQWSFWAPPTASNGTVFVLGAGLGSTLYAIDEASGNLLWTVNQDDRFSPPPAVSATRVYLPDACSFADSYGVGGGALAWGTPPVLAGSADLTRTKLGTFSAAQLPAFSEGTYYYTLGGQLVASPLGSTAATWTFAGDQSIVTAPLAVGSQVVAGSSNGNVYVVDAASGQLLSSDNVGSAIFESSGSGTARVTGFAAADGMLFVSTQSSIVAYWPILRNHPWEKLIPIRRSAIKHIEATQSTSNAPLAALVQPRVAQMPTMHSGGTINVQPASAAHWPILMGPQKAVDAPMPNSTATPAVAAPTPPRFAGTTTSK